MSKLITKAACIGLITAAPASSALAATVNVVLSGAYEAEAVSLSGSGEVIEEVVGSNSYVESDSSDTFASASAGLNDVEENFSVSVAATGSADAATGELKC